MGGVVVLYNIQEGQRGGIWQKFCTILVSYDSRSTKFHCNSPLFSTSAITLPPPFVKPALRLYISILYL
jgi:hypothetical protein